MNADAMQKLGAEEVTRGVWRWTAYHPEWKEVVACAALEAGGGTVLIDPLLPEGSSADAVLDALESESGRGLPPSIVLTVFYHQRSAARIAGRAPGTTLHVPAAGVENVDATVTHPFHAGDALPGGLAAHATARPDEVMLWHAESGTLFVGDVMLGRGLRGLELCPDSWLPDGVVAADLAASLAPLLDLAIERILPGHGDPALEDARDRLTAVLDAAR